MSYLYKNPIKNGYIKVKKARYKELIKDYKWYRKYEVYENKDCYLIHTFEPFYIILLNISFFPLYLIMYGLSDALDIFKDIYDCLFQKKTGTFLSETIWKNKLKQNNINETLKKIK